MIYYTLRRKPENATRGGTSEGREADEALVELRAEIGASLLAREIRSIARLENFEDSRQFSDFCREYQVTENAKEALINLLHVLEQRGSLILVDHAGSMEVNLMVRYTLRDRTRNPPVTEEDMLVHQVGVNPFVGLKAAGGRGAELVEEIRDLCAGLQTFGDERMVEFCRNYGVTEQRDKNALRNLLNVLKKSDLELVDPDADVPRPVNRVH